MIGSQDVLLKFSQMKNMPLRAVDRQVGNTVDLLVEDTAWNVRYLVISVDNTMPIRRVLFSPAAIDEVQAASRQFTTALTSAQVFDSPPVDWDQPISRKYEQALVDYYGWPIYWLGRVIRTPQDMWRRSGDDANSPQSMEEEVNLRSANEICGYQINCQRGPAGRLKDLVINLTPWQVEYATTDSSGGLPGESSIFATSRIREINWPDRQIKINSVGTLVGRSCQPAHKSEGREPPLPCTNAKGET